MPRKTYDELQKELLACQAELGALSTDEEWNVLTRKAIPYRLRPVAKSARYVVVITFEAIPPPGAVRRVLNVRAPQVLVRARWNAVEALFVLSSDLEEFLRKIRPVMRNEGLKGLVGYVPYSGLLPIDYARAVKSAQLFTEVA